MVSNVYKYYYWTEANNYFTNLTCRLLDDVVEECVEKMEVKLKDKDRNFIINFYRHVL